MDGWGIIAVIAGVVLCLGLVAAVGRKTRRHHRRDKREDIPHVYGYQPDAKLLSTIPSEDEVQRQAFERDLLNIDLPEQEVDLRYQHPHAYRALEENEQLRHHFIPDETIEQCISHAIVEFHRQEITYEPVDDPVEVDRLLAEAHDLMLDLNQQFGWTPGEPHIADRMFNTNVTAVIAAARSAQKIDFRTMKMIAVMRSFGRAANGGRNELAKVMAVRRLLGTGRLTEEELHKLHLARRLFGDDFAEASGYVDHLDRTDEIVAARRLGITASKETERDHKSIDIGREGVSRPFDRRPT